MRPPSRWLAPGAGTAMPPPPWPSGGGARGPEAPPHSPPPPTQAHERTEADKRNGGPAPPPKRPLHPGCGGTTAEAGARTPRLLPADGGPAAPRTAQTKRPYQGQARGRRGREPGRGGSPPPPPPLPPRTGPSAADRTAPDARGRPATFTARVYPGGACRRQQKAGGRPTGRGMGGRPPRPPPPPLPPPVWEPQERPPAPPESRGRPPPQKGPRRGGMRLDLHSARPSAPSRLLLRGSRPQGEPTPACRSNARTKLWGGARRRTRTVWRPRPT